MKHFKLEISLVCLVLACWFWAFAAAETRAQSVIINRSDVERIVRALETIAQNSKCK